MWHVFSADFWPKHFFVGAKWTDALLVLFTFALVVVGWKQVAISRKQAHIANQALETADRSRGIALAALGRPYVFFEFVSHNTGSTGWAYPWLIGRIDYAEPFGISLKTVFTLMGRGDGTAQEDSEAPYNERT